MTKISTTLVFTFGVSVSRQMLLGMSSLSGNCWKSEVAGITAGTGEEEGSGSHKAIWGRQLVRQEYKTHRITE